MARRRIAKKDTPPDNTPSSPASLPFPLPDNAEEMSESDLFEMLSGMLGGGPGGMLPMLPFSLPDNPPAPKQPPYTAPTRAEWEALYKAGVAFRDVSPWMVLEENDLFGVRDPETDETYYCCVLGGGGELSGLNVYRGSKGLAGHWKIQGQMDPEEIDADPAAAMLLQDCLTASFVDREELTDNDAAVIKELGLRFRGKGAWPQFMSYLPGFFPWQVSGPEARVLTVALEQAVTVMRAVQKDEDYLLPPAPNGHYLVRVRENGAWTERYERPAPYAPVPLTPAPVDTARVSRLKESLPRADGWAEADHFYLPMPMFEADGTRPFMPLAVLIADHGSGAILTMDFIEPDAVAERLPERLLDAIEKAGSLPARLLVAREETFACLEPTARELGIELLFIGGLDAVEQARAGLFGFLMSGMPDME
jgi:hypothetical protein